MIRAAIFDMDGTLLDSNGHWEKAPDVYLAGLGKQAQPGLAQVIFDMTLPEAADYLIREYGIEQTPEEILAGVNQAMEAFYREETPLKEGVRELIDELQMRGIPLIVATVTDRPLVEVALRRHGLLDYFEGIVTAAEVGTGKNGPAIFLEAAKRLHAKPEQTLVFEDALHAVKTAKKAGFVTVGVYDWVSEAKQEEMKRTADVYLESFTDLAPLWKKMGGGEEPKEQKEQKEKKGWFRRKK